MTAPLAFPPTLREVLFRRKWLGMLALCLAVAGIFAWLGQWQLGQAIDTNPPPVGVTENVKALEDVVEPGQYLGEPLVGQKVTVEGALVADDFLLVSSRFNGGIEGYWVTGQLRLADATEPTSIAVALGWAPDIATAEASIKTLADEVGKTIAIEGRVISDEGAVPPPRDAPFSMSRISPAMLLSQWNEVDDLIMYRPYLASASGFGGLDAIDSPAPQESSPINWLNIFYAVEWAIFAGFAFYLWYRLARDAWEREVEEFEEAATV